MSAVRAQRPGLLIQLERSEKTSQRGWHSSQALQSHLEHSCLIWFLLGRILLRAKSFFKKLLGAISPVIITIAGSLACYYLSSVRGYLLFTTFPHHLHNLQVLKIDLFHGELKIFLVLAIIYKERYLYNKYSWWVSLSTTNYLFSAGSFVVLGYPPYICPWEYGSD